MNKINYRYIAYLCCVLLTPPLQGLTIHEALSAIASNNTELHAIEAGNAARELQLRSENTLPATSVEYSPFFRSGVSGVASSELIVSQEFDFPTLYKTRSNQASLERNVLDNEAGTRRKEILTEAQSYLLELVLLKEERGIIDARMNDTKALLLAYEQRLNAGAVTKLEYNKVLLESQDLQRELLDIENQTISISNILKGLNGNKELDLTDLKYSQSAGTLEVPDNSSIMISDDQSVKAIKSEIEAARNEMKLSKSGWLPAFTIGYRRNTEEKLASNGFLIGASLPLFSNSSKIKASQSRLNAGQIAYENVISQARARIAENTDRLRIQQQILATYDYELMSETLELYRKSLDGGQITVTDYYIETSMLYDKILSRIRLENEIQKTYALLMSYKL